MPQPRHKGRHVGTRPPTPRRWSRHLAGPAAALAVLAASGAGFAIAPDQLSRTIDDAAPLPDVRSLGSVDASTRDPGTVVSRSADRPAVRIPAVVPPGRSGVETAPVPKATGHAWATADLNVWSGPGEDTSLVTEIPADTRVAVTGNEQEGWAEIIRAGMPRWVNATYLADAKPTTETTTETSTTATSSVSYAPCPLGNDVENGLTPDAVRVYRAVCAAFPQISSYGGLRPGDPDEHGTGQALDIMTSDQAVGDEIAAWVIDHRTELGVSEVLWSQQIWTVERMSEGWRTFPDRGSPTANHEDHVHVTVYGESGTG